jgi:hypothetical protein
MGVLGTLLVLASGCLAVGVTVLVRNRTVRRAHALRAFAEGLGWSFVEEVPFDAVPDLDRFELFSSGRSKKLRNLLASPPGATRALVFDYRYVTGGGKSRRTHQQTVFYATREELDLPAFSLRPEHLLHRFASLLGYQDIDFPRRPEFSMRFLLRGEDEPRIRAAFGEGVLRFFEERLRTCAGGSGSELLFWRPGSFATPEEVEQLIEDGEQLAARFLEVR